MRTVHPLTLALAFAAAASSTWAAQHDQDKVHHPAGSTAAPASKSMPAKTSPETARMANHMKAMQEMHAKMAAAKTPEERSALMAEHMKTMQEGMAMMKGMSGMGMGSMSGMANAKGAPANITERQTMMEHRMDMMQSMMEMMVDRLPQTPAKP